MKEEIILTGDNLNILGRNIITISKDYNIKIFENFNIIVLNEKEDISKEIEYRNCSFHFLHLRPVSKFIWNYKASDTLILNFINLTNTNYADYILNSILALKYKKKNFKYVHYRLLADFIDFNILQRTIEIENENKQIVKQIFGSELFVPTKIIINNKLNKKLKIDFYIFSNNYNSVGVKTITNINDFTIYYLKDSNIKVLNEDIKTKILKKEE